MMPFLQCRSPTAGHQSSPALNPTAEDFYPQEDKTVSEMREPLQIAEQGQERRQRPRKVQRVLL